MAMNTADLLATLNILVAFWGLFLVALTIFEFRKLRTLRKDLGSVEAKMRCEMHKQLKASHRVIASYAVKDLDQRIALLSSALEIDPSVFNGFNSLGYAYIEQGEIQKAADAFKDAIHRHPEDKAGYFDLAHAYLLLGDRELAVKQLRSAVKIDPTSRDDIRNDARLAGLDV